MARSGERGLTLLEVVVALAILSLCTVVLYAGMDLAMSGWRVAVHRSVDADTVLTAQQFLRARLESMSPFRPSSDDTERPVSGSPEEIEFTGPAPAAFGPGELRYRVRLRRRTTGYDIVAGWRRTWDARIDRVAGAEWHEETLLENVRGLEFQYLAAGSSWQSDWAEQSGVPALVRVTVNFEPTDGRRWPHLTVRPRIEADPQCEFDPVSRTCRDL
jgi:prepilin-type N-terminal cleavage/methylation domain-containing protein